MKPFYKKHQNQIRLTLHLLLIGAIALSLMLRAESLARDFMKFNLVIIIGYFVWQLKKKNYHFLKFSLKLAVLPASLILLNYFATGEFRYKHYPKNIILAYGVLISIIMLQTHNVEKVKIDASRLVKVIIFFYTICQILALTYGWSEYGTTTNPHFLGIYSAICFSVSLFYFLRGKTPFRYIYLSLALILILIILYTSSRPLWIGMILSMGFLFFYMDKRSLIKFLLLFITSQLLLVGMNTFNYGSRLYELAENIQTEERVYVWHDAWELQIKSPPKAWLVGNGLNSFHEAYKPYAKLRGYKAFRSAHNLILEMLYISGILGLLIIAILYSHLYRQWLYIRKKSIEFSYLAGLVLIIMTFSLVLNGLNFPFCSSTSIYPVAFIVGLLQLIRIYSKNHIHSLSD